LQVIESMAFQRRALSSAIRNFPLIWFMLRLADGAVQMATASDGYVGNESPMLNRPATWGH